MKSQEGHPGTIITDHSPLFTLSISHPPFSDATISHLTEQKGYRINRHCWVCLPAVLTLRASQDTARFEVAALEALFKDTLMV